MRDPTFYVSGLLELHKLGAAERRATWRQSMAALARATAEEGPAPLDGLHPDALVQGVRAALAAGLVDDLDWLAPAAAGAALYELASSLPLGHEQRELGRRVLSRIVSGSAEEFVAVATRMALGAGKGLAAPATRARVALVTELPFSLGVADGPLALAIVSRRELSREWIVGGSTGSLADRRLAARLLERAAREAARRAQQGDDYSLRAFKSDGVAQAWERLLADRESLVWRHVAVARGLLAPFVSAMREQITKGLGPELSPTEWRRAATSLVAELAVAPEEAMRLLQPVLSRSGTLARDPGGASAFAWGIPRAAEAEPEAAAELLDALLERAPHDVAESMIDLRFELGQGSFLEGATRRTVVELEKHPRPSGGDDGAESLANEVLRDLRDGAREDPPLRDQLMRALVAYVHDGARAAHGLARAVLEAAEGTVGALDAVTVEDDAAEGRAGSIARRTSFAALRDLDITLLERPALEDLLRLGSGADAVRAHEGALDALRERIAAWILAREGRPLDGGPQSKPRHVTSSLRRLRALLHLVDGDLGDTDDTQRAAALRKRYQRVAHALLDRFEKDPPSAVRRTTLAALARALDALVRGGALDVSDALLVVARHVQDASEFSTLAEAAMDPDLVHVLSRYAVFATALAAQKLSLVASGDSLPPLSSIDGAADETRRMRAFEELTRELAPDASGRTEALRMVLARLHGALAAIAQAPSLRALCTSPESGEPDVVSSLEAALGALSQLAIGARARLDPDRAAAASPPAAGRPLTVAVSRVLSGVEPQLRDDAVSACLDELVAAVPKAIGRLVSGVVWPLVERPVDRPSIESSPVRVSQDALPVWLPPRRTLGGFYVLRALSSGAVGSVFIVTRVEDRHEAAAERFALKVPEYSATAARSVSEAEFMKMFREEASALLSLPHHPNLARFVTFDVGAKPKPILVMELVEGPTLEKLVESGTLDVKRALRALDDVLAGLETMHAVGVGHLDIKPSNVVLRRGEEAVLVDFGLAGRHLRPGCATGPYGAPEVWGADIEKGFAPRPQEADVYAFGCVAYEALTGKTLFQGDNEMQQIAQHVAHDGFPPPVRAMALRPELAPLAELLFAALRRDPRNRASASSLRATLKRIAPSLSRGKWPVA